MDNETRTYPVQEAVRAQEALREFGGQAPEQFPIQAFVGMISDEIEHLRKLGHSDEKIAEVITSHSKIQISASELAENYASPEERHPHGE